MPRRILHFLGYVLLLTAPSLDAFISPPLLRTTTHHLLAVATNSNELDYDGRLSSTNQNYRCGFCCIVGAPNMGKSTLLNALLEQNLCITTARPQTTRHAILGLLSTEHCQVCLIDTPGILNEPAYKLQDSMMEAVKGAWNDADVMLVVTDLHSTPIPDDVLFQKLQQTTKPVIVAINKVDLVATNNTSAISNAVSTWRQLLPQAVAIIPTAARLGPNEPGVEVLRRILTGGPDLQPAIRNLGRPVPGMFRADTMSNAQALLPLSPALYHPDQLTDRTERFIASELIREALFECLDKELPYSCQVQIDDFKEPRRKPIIRIAASVIVERDSQKIIVIGKGGTKIKQVGMRARKKLQEFLQSQVFLDLRVKVSKDWRKREDKLKEYGYFH